MKETLDNSQGFEPGELMPWQEMSKIIREHDEELSRIVALLDTIVSGGMPLRAQISDIKTRLDDLEEQMGKLSPNWLCLDNEAVEHDSIDHYYGSLNFEKECPDSQVYIESWISGNSGFENSEIRRGSELELAGTHPPNCRCAWCEPQEGLVS